MKKVLPLLIVLLLLSGCSSYNLELVERGGGINGIGEASESGNKVTINIDGIEYKGKYTYNDGSTSAITNSYSSSYGYGTTTGSGLAFTNIVSNSGNGNILAISDDGGSIRCQFSFDNNSGNGIGECIDSTNKIYELLISTQ